jgi:hypothetical protein
MTSHHHNVDFSDTLVPVRGQALEKGDTVYEVSYPHGPDKPAKLRKCRVLDTMRAAVRCQCEGESKPRTIPFTHLRMELPAKPVSVRPVRASEPARTPDAPKPTTPPATPPATAPVSARAVGASTDAEFEAWAEMGGGLIEKLRTGLQSDEEALSKLVVELEKIDAQHRADIEALEQELIEAKRAHEEARALVATRRDSLQRSVARRRGRMEALQALVEGDDA